MLELTTGTRIKPVFKCPEDYKARFSQAHCLLTISVGQEVHEGEKFLTTIDLVNKAFKQCTLCVDDSLQRHTMGLESDLSSDELYRVSIEEGDRWLERNKTIYSRLTIPYSIIRWNKWLMHAKYNYFYESISAEIEKDSEYRECFYDTINEFIRRYEKRIKENSRFDRLKIFEICFTYLKEECTALCLWQEGGFDFEVYPSKRNPTMTTAHEKFVKPNNPVLLNPVAIKFKDRKQLKPQTFNTVEGKEVETYA